MKNSFPLQRGFRRRRQRASHGLSLATMIAMLFIMALVGGSALSLVNTSLKISRKQIDSTEALNMADAGVDLAYTWMSTQDPPPLAANLQTMSNFYGTNGTITAPFGETGTSLVVRISADAANPSSTQKKYLVESKATMPSGAFIVVRAYMQQVSFGKYAFFTVNDGDGYWTWQNHFEGPFHSNDSDNKQTMILWTTGQAANPMFQYTGPDAFSVSGDVTWWKNSIGNVSAPTTTDDFNSLAAGGRASVNTGYKTDANGVFLLDTSGRKIPNSPQIPLPATDYAQQYAALGLVAPVPTTSAVPSATLTSMMSGTTQGVKYTPGGGLYIKSPSTSSTTPGDNDMVLQVDGAGNQQIVVSQKKSGLPYVQTVTISPTLNLTTITTVYNGITSVSVNSGVPNGMVYSDGTITNLSGTVANNRVTGSGSTAAVTNRNALTIATDISAGRDIMIADDIKYQVTRDLTKKQTDDTNYNLNAGTLGILTRNAIVRTGAAATDAFNLRIDASIFATGTFKAQTTTGYIGQLVQTGGVIVKDSGIFANGDASGALVSGYNEEYHYDNRFADNPPPFFPTTGTHYDVTSWQRVLTPL